MARPKREDRERLVTTVLPETRTFLDKMADADGTSFGKVIDKIVAEYMKDHKEVEDHK